MKSDSHQSSKSWRTDWSNPWSKLSCCKLKVSGARFGSWCSLWCIFWRYWVGETLKSVDGVLEDEIRSRTGCSTRISAPADKRIRHLEEYGLIPRSLTLPRGKNHSACSFRFHCASHPPVVELYQIQLSNLADCHQSFLSLSGQQIQLFLAVCCTDNYQDRTSKYQLVPIYFCRLSTHLYFPPSMLLASITTICFDFHTFIFLVLSPLPFWFETFHVWIPIEDLKSRFRPYQRPFVESIRDF